MSLRGITEMDLSQNNLSGEIPVFMEIFSNLQLLNLSFNNLKEMVPTGGVFGNLSKGNPARKQEAICNRSI